MDNLFVCYVMKYLRLKLDKWWWSLKQIVKTDAREVI